MKFAKYHFYILLISLTLAFRILPGYSQSIAVNNKSVQSSIMKQEMNYSILLPENYYTSTAKYPVLYLLHGFGGNHNSWLIRCQINELVDSLKINMNLNNFIIVMPDAGNSYFINNYDSSYMLSDFLAYELVPAIDSLYRTEPDFSSRAIMGLSMGGFGAIINTMKHPKLFGSVVALSAAIRTEAIFKSLPQARYERYFGNVYGPGLSDSARITTHWKEYSPYLLMDTIMVENMKAINWYIDCGMSDFLLPANEEFHKLLVRYNIPHEYHVRPGKHNWAYWYKSTIYGLLFLNEKFRF